MKKNFGMYYTYQKEMDELLILFNNSLIEKEVNRDDITVCYNKDEVVAYKIFNIKRLVKIHVNGQIVFPNSSLVEVINSLLKKENLELLVAPSHSGFYISKVISNDDKLVLKSDKEIFELEKNSSLIQDDVVVIMKKGTFNQDKKMVNEDTLCTFKMLGINDIDKVLIDNTLKEGDFYQIKE